MGSFRRSFAWFLAVLSFFAIVPSAAAAWTVLVDNSAVSSPVSEPRSLRAIALTPDAALLYASFIQGSSSHEVREYDAATGVELRSFRVSTGTIPAVSIAVDDRGIVYAGRNPSDVVTDSVIRIFDADDSFAKLADVYTAAVGHDKRPRGMKVVRFGSDYRLYTAGASSTSGNINRWNVDDPANPVLDTTFSGDGLFDIATLDSDAVFLRGLDVAADGTIYVAAGVDGGVAGGDIFKVSPDLTTISSATLPGSRTPHDVALHGDLLYVSTYDGAGSRVEVYEAATLAHVTTIDVLTESGTARGSEEGFPGIEVASDGRVFVADQLYLSSSPNFNDRIFVSSATPPAVDSVTPVFGPAAGGTAVTIAGSGFQAGAEVTFGSVPCTAIIVVDTETITCTTPAHASGSVAVTVTNPDDQSDVLSAGFLFLPGALPPSEIPTASETGLLLLGFAISAAALIALRRR